MIFKHQEVHVPPEPGSNPFENCKLGREKYGTILTDMVGSYADGFVLAIDNKWGTGKTTFIRMWRQQLENNGFKTVLFNAWEHDFDDKPLVALVSTIKEIKWTGSVKSRLFKSVLKNAAKLSKNVLPDVLSAIASKYIDIDRLKTVFNKEDLKKFVSGISETALEIFEDEVKEYSAKKKSLEDFRQSLKKYVAGIPGDKALIFIIDELDRCRPNYAVKVLEQVKHFFSVPGIVFVLSIDKEQLGHAVKGAYGSEHIDSDEYLRRFIDFEYTLPQPFLRDFCDYLSIRYNLNSFFDSHDRKVNKGMSDELKMFNSFTSSLFESAGLTLRQAEKMYINFRILLPRFSPKEEIYPEALIFLVYCKFFRSDFFNRLISLKIASSSLKDAFLQIIPRNRSHNDNMTFLKIEAALLYINESLFTANPFQSIFNTRGDIVPTCNYSSALGFSNQEFGREIQNFATKYRIDGRTSRYILDKINTFSQLNS